MSRRFLKTNHMQFLGDSVKLPSVPHNLWPVAPRALHHLHLHNRHLICHGSVTSFKVYWGVSGLEYYVECDWIHLPFWRMQVCRDWSTYATLSIRRSTHRLLHFFACLLITYATVYPSGMQEFLLFVSKSHSFRTIHIFGHTGPAVWAAPCERAGMPPIVCSIK